MILAGIGIVFSRGRGVGALETALREGWQPPQSRAVESSPGVTVPVYSVGEDTLRDRSVLGGMRRADRFTRMSVLAASDALIDGGIEIGSGSRDLGILLATGLGSHATGFRFLEEMLVHGEAATSPTLFSQSVQNAAASHVSLRLQAHGPAMTLTQFHFSFHQAILLASAWLAQDRCAQVLVGATEECGAVMEYVSSQRVRLAANGRIEPLRCAAAPEAVPGEGSVFFLLTREETSRRYCEIEAPDVSANTACTRRPPDLVLLDADGFTPDETIYRQAAEAAPIAAYNPIFGSMMTGTAFHCAVAAIMLRKQVCFASPAIQNPHGLKVPAASGPADLEEIECIRYDCCDALGVVRLRR